MTTSPETLAVPCAGAVAIATLARTPVIEPDIPASEVAAAVGADVAALTAAGDRGNAVTTMARGAEVIAARLHAEGRLDGLLAIGGSGGTSIASAAARALPIGAARGGAPPQSTRRSR